MKAIKTITESKKSIAKRIGTINAKEAVKGFAQNNRVTGLTNGAFSLISLIDAILEITGVADVVVSTWSAGVYDVNEINNLQNSGKISDFRMILDRSFATRQSGYAATVDQLFSPEKIRTTNTHSKFVLIKNENWNVCIRSSMNLNENKRCENFDIDNDIDIFNLFNDFTNDLFGLQIAGIIEERKIVDKTFDKVFQQTSMNFNIDFSFKFGE